MKTSLTISESRSYDNSELLNQFKCKFHKGFLASTSLKLVFKLAAQETARGIVNLRENEVEKY